MEKESIDIQKLYDLTMELKRKIAQYRELFSKNEASVRYALINPLLQALGWDLTNPDEVIPEYSTDVGRPDYVLKKEGIEIAFLGAKKLYTSENLIQYISYCVSKGVSYFIRTDGSSWDIYDTYKKEDLEHKIILSWKIEEDSPEEIVRKSLALAKPLIYVSGNKNKEIKISEVRSYINISQKNKDIPINNSEKISNGKINISIDGRILASVNTYVDVLYQTVEWLINNGYINKEDLPIKVGNKGKNNLISLNNEWHGMTRRQLSNGWYLLTNFGKYDIKRLSQKLIEKYGKGHKLEIKDVVK